MILLKLCLYLMPLLNVSNNIVVIGTAEDAKGGAVVIAKDDKKIYYVDGLAAWDQKVIGKVVRVSGKLFLKYWEPLKPGEPEKQQMTGTQRIIQKPKWEVVR